MSAFTQLPSAETLCELCGETFPHPVTYHMRQCHSGCGQHAGGKGYNSDGNYCLGWAGNCGEGGVRKSSSKFGLKFLGNARMRVVAAGSTWYLLCENCREKYIKNNRGGKQVCGRSRIVPRRKPTFVKSLVSPSNSSIMDIHLIMKSNAMFLLELASSADISMTHRRRSSMVAMHSASENSSPPEYSGPFSPIPPFQCLQALGAHLINDEPPVYEEVMRKQHMQDFQFGPSSSGQRVSNFC